LASDAANRKNVALGIRSPGYGSRVPGECVEELAAQGQVDFRLVETIE